MTLSNEKNINDIKLEMDSYKMKLKDYEAIINNLNIEINQKNEKIS
jgi:hypothetical protein